MTNSRLDLTWHLYFPTSISLDMKNERYIGLNHTFTSNFIYYYTWQVISGDPPISIERKRYHWLGLVFKSFAKTNTRLPIYYTNYSCFIKVKDCQKVNYNSIHSIITVRKGIDLFNEAQSERIKQKKKQNGGKMV